MNTTAAETQRSGLTTADLAAAAERPIADREELERRTAAPDGKKSTASSQDEPLAALFPAEVAKDFRARWDAVQSSFVDDPKQAVRQGDELVAQVMKSLADTFAKERAQLEGQLDQPDEASTENLRVALRRYRSFFKRLLSL
jgi:hypothetical protein